MCYLLFCLLAICGLAAGVVVATQSLIAQRDEHVHLSQLRRAAAAVEMDYIRNGTSGLAELLARFKAEGRLTYCAVVGLDGRYLAHTSPDLLESPSTDHRGTHHQGEEFGTVGFVGADSRLMREYRFPLMVQNEYIGQLRFGAALPDPWLTVLQTVELTSLAALGSLLLVGVGAVFMAKQARPLAEVEAVLCRLAREPVGETLTLDRQAPRSAVALGWNRLVSQLEQWQNGASAEDIEQRISKLSSRIGQTAGLSVLDHIPEGIAVTDEQGVLTQANPAFAGLLGLAGEVSQLLGKRVEQCLGQVASAEQLVALTEPQAHLRSVVVELEIAFDTDRRTLRLARHPWRDADGGLLGHVWTMRDITQQKLSEKMRNQFLDAATHELRTPLTSIKAYAELLSELDETDVESQKEFCNTINSEATRLSRFVDDLLSISSMEMGSLSLTRQNTDMKRLLDEVVDKVEPLVKQSGQSFDVTLPAKLPELNIDKDKVMVTLINLLGNAVKYTPEGGRIGLKVKSVQDQLVIDIVDTGYGIASEEQPKVFEKFFRSADNRVLKKTGTGLGLPLAREVIRLHGGDITLTSALDQGSTFTVTLSAPAS